MTSSPRSTHRRRNLGRLFAAVLATSFVLSSVGHTESARAAPPAAGVGTSTYAVVVTPNDVTLCPGETRQVAVRVRRQVTRMVRGQAVTGRPGDVRRARIRSSAGDSSIASVSPGDSPTVPLQFASGGRSQHSGAWFTVTAGTLGDTFIDFQPLGLINPGAVVPAASDADDDLASLGTPPRGRLTVHVKCQFRVTLDGQWTIPGEGATLRAHMLVRDVGLAPDEHGQFQVDADTRNNVTRIAAACGGSASIGSAKAHFSGSVTSQGLLQVNVTFGAAPNTGTEGCVGKSVAGSSTVQPLTFSANVSTGQRRFFFQLPHVLEDQSGSHSGSTIVYLTVLP